MTQVLVILHFLGFVAGIGLGMANMITGIRAGRTDPAVAPALRQLQPVFSKGAALALALLWLTGVLLIVTGPGAAVLARPLFTMKMLAVLLLTGLTVVALRQAARGKAAGTPPDPQRMKRLGMGMLTAAIAALILAVLAFR